MTYIDACRQVIEQFESVLQRIENALPKWLARFFFRRPR